MGRSRKAAICHYKQAPWPKSERGRRKWEERKVKKRCVYREGKKREKKSYKNLTKNGYKGMYCRQKGWRSPVQKRCTAPAHPRKGFPVGL